MGRVRARVSRPLPKRTGAATFKVDPRGNWHATFVVELEQTPISNVKLDAVGIDLGLRRFATLSDGRFISNPRFRQAAERRLTREHRKLSRKRRGSRNRARQAARLSREYARVANRRADFLHKLSTDVAASYTTICIENLNVSGLARAKLSRQMHDVAFREFRRHLEYKVPALGGHLIAVGRFFPSSKQRSDCGAYAAKFKSDDPVWECECGLRVDRDLNAARNIVREGLSSIAAAGDADAQNARGAGVRPSNEGSRRRSANPTGDRKSEVLYSSPSTRP